MKKYFWYSNWHILGCLPLHPMNFVIVWGLQEFSVVSGLFVWFLIAVPSSHEPSAQPLTCVRPTDWRDPDTPEHVQSFHILREKQIPTVMKNISAIRGSFFNVPMWPSPEVPTTFPLWARMLSQSIGHFGPVFSLQVNVSNRGIMYLISSKNFPL